MDKKEVERRGKHIVPVKWWIPYVWQASLIYSIHIEQQHMKWGCTGNHHIQDYVHNMYMFN